MSTATHPIPGPGAAVVWIDHWHALVARREHGERGIVNIPRAVEPEAAYVRRVADAIKGCSRLMILGPDEERLELDRVCEANGRRAHLFVDVEAAPATSLAELRDRLRLLEGDALAGPAG